MYTYIADFQGFADDSNKDMTDQEQSSGSESDIGSEVDEDEDPAGINIAAPSSSSSTVNADVDLVGDSGMTCLFNQTSDHTINDLSQNPECAPCQPQLKQFPKQKIAKVYRSFRSSFYATYQWLEYSVEKDSVYCFYCRHFAKLNRDSRTKAVIDLSKPVSDSILKPVSISWYKQNGRFVQRIDLYKLRK